MTREITVTQLATQMGKIKRWLEIPNAEFIVVNQKTKKPFARLTAFNTFFVKDEEIIDATAEFDKYIIPLTEEETQNPYALSQEIPKGYSQKSVFRHRNQH